MNYENQRREMLAEQLRPRGINDPRVLGAMGAIPRELFVAERFRAKAYHDAPLDIAFGQTISQPYMTALMVQMLELHGNETVLDVGSGSGYHAAVLASVARQVYSIERIPELADLARENLEKAGFRNVVVIAGDGSLGLPEHAPYGGISVAAGSPEIPPALINQLDDPGRLVIPVGTMEEQDLWVVEKTGGKITRRQASGCRFVPLRGEQGWREE